MKWREIVSDYFYFTRKERIGYLFTVLLLLFIIFAPSILISKTDNTIKVTTRAWIDKVKKLEQKNNYKNQENDLVEDIRNFQFDPSNDRRLENKNSIPFYFDPNNLDEQGWQKLLLNKKTILTILKYRNKGGQFNKPEDLKKIYGLSKRDYERLVPYVIIQPKTFKKGVEEDSAGKTKIKERLAVNAVKGKFRSIDINSADTSAFISLPGIGTKLAARIVIFRDKLGGFISIEQVGETFGLPDSTFQKIRPSLYIKNNFIKKININTATVDALKAHPYINHSTAVAIVAYRKEHGMFTKVDDIKKLIIVTDDLYQKMEPYLTVQ